MDTVSFGFVLTAILTGLAVGFIMQRGRFCMNTAFRDMIFIKDFTLTRTYLVALLVMIVFSNLLTDVGRVWVADMPGETFIGVINLQLQTFRPLANIVGGFIFGLGIVLAGGCGSGIIYRMGEGVVSAGVAVMGFFLGMTMTHDGVLKPVYEWFKSIEIGTEAHPQLGVWHFLGAEKVYSFKLFNATWENGMADGVWANFVLQKWIVIAVIAAVFLYFIMQDKPFKPGKQKGFYWSVTGLLLGLVGVFAFWASEYYGGFARGLNFTTPTRELGYTLINGNSNAISIFKEFKIGPFATTWPALYVIGVPVGAFISAKILGEFKLKLPPVDELLTVFGGSLMMGFGAILAGGCNVGQALTGASTLGVGSVIATIAIIGGNWTMVYFKFIKPMKDLDI